MSDVALGYLEHGFSVIPIRRQDKRPLVAWKEYQARRATPEEVNEWGDAALAFVCGAVSGNLECIDFDQKARGNCLTDWRDLVERELPGFLKTLPCVRTPSGGYHVWYRCVEAVEGNQKLAEYNEGGEQFAWIETRGEGGYALVPPSPDYVAVHGDTMAVPFITTEQREVLIECARSFNEVHAKPTGSVHREVAQVDDNRLKPGDDFNERGDITPLLEREGWTLAYQRGDTQYWRRPGKKRGISATYNHLPGIFNVFTTSGGKVSKDGAGSSTGYDHFAVYALLEHNGDFSAAARDLYAQGFGARVESSSNGTAIAIATTEESLQVRKWDLASILESGEDLFLLELPETPPFLPVLGQPGFFMRGRTHLFAGVPKVGKTELLARQVVDWASTGEEILFLTEEPTQDNWARRIRTTGTDPTDWRNVAFGAVMGWPPDILLEQAFNLGKQVVIVDTARNLLQMDENDNADIVRRCSPWCLAAQQFETTLILVVHHRKSLGLEPGERIAGGNALLGIVDCAIEVERVPGEPRESLRRQVSGIGRYPGGAPDTMVYEWDQSDGRFYPQGTPGKVRLEDGKQEVLSRLPDRATDMAGVKVKDLCELLDVPQQEVSRVLAHMEKEGLAEREKLPGERAHRWWAS